MIRPTIAILLFVSAFAGFAKDKIVFVAGRPSHGSGDHEFNAGCKLLANALNEQSGLDIEAVVHSHAWPDASAFDGAKAVILFMDGGRGHPVIKHEAEIEALTAKGIGLMCMHYGVEVPAGDPGDAFKRWIGGHYETNWSINPHWVAKSELNTKHPATNGVGNFELKDEWYYNMRFRDDMEGVTPILNATPDDVARSGSTSWPRGPKKNILANKGRSEILMWSVERKDGGRGAGFTGGHFHKNWADDNLRKLILNTIVWVAGQDVPADGVKSESLTEEGINANLDKKKKMKRISLTAKSAK
ncbi:MAG: type 1 glutamine amidotransferase [Rhodothermales bacterium]|jgi:type 1 glutamine amidotransferase